MIDAGCPMLQTPVLAGDLAHRSEVDGTCRIAIMHIFSVDSDTFRTTPIGHTGWRYSLAQLVKVEGACTTTFGVNGMPMFSCDPTIPSLSESLLCDEGGR